LNREAHPDNYQPLNFNGLYLITSREGLPIYAAKQLKNLTHNNRPEWEESTYFINIGPDNLVRGYSELRLKLSRPSVFFKNKPLEQGTYTYNAADTNNTRKGLSTLRILSMNALSQMIYQLPLHSSTHFLHDEIDRLIQPQKLVWEKLVQQGIAQKYPEGEEGHDRFVIINPPTP